MSALLELAERCEAATGPDRLADQAIGWVFGTQRWRGSSPTEYDGPLFTASVDAALTLVPEIQPLTMLSVTGITKTKWVAYVRNGSITDPHVREWQGCAATLALAICAAALRARAAQ